jgi:hypothetical protein
VQASKQRSALQVWWPGPVRVEGVQQLDMDIAIALGDEGLAELRALVMCNPSAQPTTTDAPHLAGAAAAQRPTAPLPTAAAAKACGKGPVGSQAAAATDEPPPACPATPQQPHAPPLLAPAAPAAAGQAPGQQRAGAFLQPRVLSSADRAAAGPVPAPQAAQQPMATALRRRRGGPMELRPAPRQRRPRQPRATAAAPQATVQLGRAARSASVSAAATDSLSAATTVRISLEALRSRGAAGGRGRDGKTSAAGDGDEAHGGEAAGGGGDGWVPNPLTGAQGKAEEGRPRGKLRRGLWASSEGGRRPLTSPDFAWLHPPPGRAYPASLCRRPGDVPLLQQDPTAGDDEECEVRGRCGEPSGGPEEVSREEGRCGRTRGLIPWVLSQDIGGDMHGSMACSVWPVAVTGVCESACVGLCRWKRSWTMC